MKNGMSRNKYRMSMKIKEFETFHVVVQILLYSQMHESFAI
jgi:hypothetical protein